MRAARRSRQSALVLVDDRQRSYDTLGSRGDPRGSQGAISEELGGLEGVGESGGEPWGSSAFVRARKVEAPIRLSRQSRLLGRLSRSSPPKGDGNTLVDSCIPK
jgi:hypothetical protein